MLKEGVAGDGAFMEGHELGALCGGGSGEGFDLGEVELLVVVAMFELGDGDFDILHGNGPV